MSESSTAPAKKRRGKAVKGKKGEAAQFQPGGAAAPVFDPETLAEKLHLWWEDGDGQTFIVGHVPAVAPVAEVAGEGDIKPPAQPQTWSRWPEKKIVNLLRLKHWTRVKAREGEVLGEADQVLLHVMEKRRLGLAISALAGYRAGIHEICGERVLVRTSPPQLVEPEKGNWETVFALLDSKLNLSADGKSGPDQTVYFHAWMKTALEGLYQGGPGNFRPGQCCIFAGKRDSGKSRIQHQVITGLLGGRSADPGPYLFGRTDFNGEMFGAEHLMMEDPASGTLNKDRIYFGEMLKQLVVNDTQRLHRKREDALTVAPFFRTTISVNDDPDKMRVLPLLTPDIRDKVMLFLISDAPLPMETKTLEQRAAFRAMIARELPAYAWYLLNVFQVPKDLESARFGVKEWHHPALAMELFDDTPAGELMLLLDAADFWAGATEESQRNKLWELTSHGKMDETWEGSALELERLLLGEGGWNCSVAREMKKLSQHNKVDRLLSRLKEDQPARVSQHRTKLERRWVVSRP